MNNTCGRFRWCLGLLLALAIACGGGGSSSSSGSSNSTPVAPTFTTQPTSQTASSGSTTAFTVAASGNPAPALAWERSNDSGNTWAAISGATSATYGFTPAKADNGAEFKATATNSVSVTTSNPATLTVQWLTLTSQPAGQAVTAPNAATFMVAVDANPAPTYQWQSSPDGVSWTSIPGAAGSSYTTATTTVSNNGTQYHCVVSNAATTLTSNPATLSVNAPLVGPAFTTQPTSQTVDSGGTVSFTVAASGNPSPTFTWERSNDSGNTWATIGGAVSSTYSFSVSSTDNGSEFRALATNSVGTTDSNPATLTVTPVVYVAGNITNSSMLNIPGYWLNGTWNGLPLPSGTNFGDVFNLAVSGGNVYAAGYAMLSAAASSSPGYWLNGVWVGLTIPSGFTNGGAVESIAISGNNVYAAGNVTNPSYLTIAGYWLNGNWEALTPPSGYNSNAWAQSVVLYGNNIYISGFCYKGATVVPGYWLNGTWVGLVLPSGYTSSGGFGTMAVSGTGVYVSGYTSNGSVDVPGYWLNGTWVGLTLPSGCTSGDIYSMALTGTNVYIGGMCANNSGGNFPGYWVNGTWVGLTLPTGLINGGNNSTIVSGSNVYSGGGCNDGSGNYVPGYWLNGNWVSLPLPSGSSSTGDDIYSIVVN